MSIGRVAKMLARVIGVRARAVCIAASAALVVGASVLPAQASCGAVSCFVVIGSQQQVPQKGLLTVNLIYNHTPSEAASGQGGGIPFSSQGSRQLILANLNVNAIRTLVRTATLDMNYGLTDRLGLQVTVPYKFVHADAQLGLNTSAPYADRGIGDMRMTLKYNVLPTLRSMVVFGVGVDLPTGDYNQRGSTGALAESTLQIGKGQVGVVPTVYQSYELIPHRLNQFAMASYRHTWRNSDGYQFGDELNVSFGFNIIPFEKAPWLVLMQQVNYRWIQQDNLNSTLSIYDPILQRTILLDGRRLNRDVPTTGSTYLAYSPGIMLNLWDLASAYFIAQIPVARDFNGNLEQQLSFIGGITKTFNVPSPF
ncbi:MAG: transporter [Nitrospiraceae bacterium]